MCAGIGSDVSSVFDMRGNSIMSECEMKLSEGKRRNRQRSDVLGAAPLP